MTIDELAQHIAAAKTKTQFQAVCDMFAREHGEAQLTAALETIEEIHQQDLAETRSKRR